MTTSSYAVLALLDLRPWSAYELTHQAQRSLRYAWPKSERLLYSEPKKLVELGYATVEEELQTGRSRSIYTITAEGRAALREWITTRTQPPRLEVEALLRLLFADHGSKDDVLGALDELESDIGEHHRAIVELMGSYLDGGHPFPQRTHLSVLFATFQIEVFKTMERWIDFARSEIDEWPKTGQLGMTERTEMLTRLLAQDESPLSHEGGLWPAGATVARIWRGWTTAENADTYQGIAESEVFPAIIERQVPGLLGAHLMRAEDVVDDEVEFTTIIWFDDLDSVKNFMGDDYRRAHIPDEVESVLTRYDSEATHFHITGRFHER